MKKKFIALILAVIMTATCVGAGVLNSPDIQLVDVESGESVSTVEIPRSERSEIAVDYDGSDLAYQWQLSSDGKTWINVYGQTEESIKLSYAMVCNMLSDDGTAQVRCIVTDADNKYESNTAEVSFVEDKAVSAVDNSAAAKPAALAVKKSTVAAQSDPAETPSTYTILINYIFTDGSPAANPWTATIAAGSNFTQTVKSPTVVGYAPDQESVDVNVTNASKDVTYNVNYRAAKVKYTVRHYQQNLENDNYTLVDTETRKGTTATEVGGSLAKTYTGFYSLLYDTTTKIAADGSTEVEIYYDRYYYLMSFDLDGGYGVEPIYARYGAPISVGEPTKAGYTFAGWDKKLPTTMLAENTSYKATWTPGSSGFTVVFWYENANDNGYSVAGTYKPDDVAPGTEKKSDDYKNQSFTGRDDSHFTYNAAKSQTVTVKGDGSTVLNVYFTRNTYTLKFRVFDCDNNSWWHEHDDNCYKVIKTITAKYQADIHSNFPIKQGNNTIWWDVPDGCKSFKEGTMLGSIDTMPGENITFTSAGTQSGATLYYYVETLNGEKGTYTHDGKNFKLYKQITLEKECQLTYSEEFHNITGFTQWWSDPKFDKMEQGGVAYAGYYYDFLNRIYYINEQNYLCYTRNSYNLKFYNYNEYVNGKGGSVQFEAPLRSYYFVPDYPAVLEPNAYVFAGWYTTAGCYDGSEADLNTMEMPASDVILYAKWTPKTHTVKTYLTKDAMDNGADPLHTWDAVEHGKTATPKAETPKNGDYKFVGWFYTSDTGEEKAFDFSMPVNRDLELYAKWRSDVIKPYTIHYRLRDGSKDGIEIAPDTEGSALAGTTKTFEAKTGKQLNAGYQSGYFPETSSHSLTIDIDGTPENGKNEYTFWYVEKKKVKYTVRYLEKDTNKVLLEEKQGETSDAVITEKFKQIKGYIPDAYQKRLVLSADEKNNVITFWYSKDDAHAPVQIIHWTQNIAGNGYTEYQSSTSLNTNIGDEVTEELLNINGFEYKWGTAVAGESTENFTAPATPKAVLTEKGLVLNLYYDRIEYPYEFRFLEQGTNKQLADPEGGSARYQAQVTQSAKTIPGYKLVGYDQMSINIAIEDPADTANKNVKTFYYEQETVDIKYKVAGPEGCGTLDNYQDNGIGVISADLKGSTPTAEDGFKFVGWFKDEACTQPVSSSWVVANSKLTPGKTKDYGNRVMGYEAATYYAKFEYDVSELTITKTGCQVIDANQSFIFHVTGEGKDMYVTVQGNGSVTIKGLTVGTYKVEEVTSWSWRYTPDNVSKNVEVKGGQPNEVTFNNSRTNGSWLSGDSFAINRTGGRR